jgi:hypothetical protein
VHQRAVDERVLEGPQHAVVGEPQRSLVVGALERADGAGEELRHPGRTQTGGAMVTDVRRRQRTERIDARLGACGVGGVTTFADVGGGLFVTGQSGEVLRFYELETGVERITLPVDTVRNTNVAFTPDGSALYYEANNGLLRRFPMDHAELADLARARVQRDFTAEECERFDIAPDCSIYAE